MMLSKDETDTAPSGDRSFNDSYMSSETYTPTETATTVDWDDDDDELKNPEQPRQKWYHGLHVKTWNYIKSITWQGWVKIGIAVLIVILIVCGLIWLPWPDWLGDFLDFVEDLGWWGPILLAEMYIACTLLFVPGTILTVGAGFIFNNNSVWKAVAIGTVSVSIGSTIGACGAFLFGKTLLRGWVEKRISSVKIFKAVDIAIAKKGWLIVLLLRLSPVIPFNLLNYALGVTRVDFIPYALASWIGMLPATVVYVWIGTTLSELSQVVGGGQSNWATITLLIVGLVATFAALLVVSWYAKRVITSALDDAELEAGRLEVNAEPSEIIGYPVDSDADELYATFDDGND